MTKSKLALAGALLLSSAFAVQAASLADTELRQFDQAPAYGAPYARYDDALDARAEAAPTSRAHVVRVAPATRRGPVVIESHTLPGDAAAPENQVW